jgi:endonuclease/exonuclease/phosphatase family metal-dependent hydrolase
MKGDYDLDLIAGVINTADPGLVAMQEVDFMTRRARGYDLASELGMRTRKVSLFGRAMNYDGGEYGEGILSDYTFIATRTIPLPYSGTNEPRAALEITTVLPSGDTILFIGTHFDHTGNETDRILQARKINEIIVGARYPVILAGDLNAVPGSVTINLLEEHWGITYDKARPSPTFPSDQPERKIDYVMYYPKDRWKVVSSEVICNATATDHCAHLVVLELIDSKNEN